jgi:hypothetical protein
MIEYNHTYDRGQLWFFNEIDADGTHCVLCSLCRARCFLRLVPRWLWSRFRSSSLGLCRVSLWLPWRLRLSRGFPSASFRLCVLVAAAFPSRLLRVRCLRALPSEHTLARLSTGLFHCVLYEF